MNGRIFLFGDNIDTDIIAPGGYLHLSIEVLKMHCMEALDRNFSGKVNQGDIVVAGRNFGTGSSREQAPVALKELGIQIVLAVSFARIFFRNAVNVGLNIGIISESDYSAIQDGEAAEFNNESGILTLKTRGMVVKYDPPRGPLEEIILSGGLVNYVRKKLGTSTEPSSRRPQEK
ncbi:MAG: LeuD/DmdB family oxidoreductase small subunit [Thermoplasmataceae archaeon]